METLKLLDPKKINSGGIIDLDEFLRICLEYNKMSIERVRNPLENIYIGGDLDGDKSIEKFEFVLMCQLVERDQISNEKIDNLFDINAFTLAENKLNIPVLPFAQFEYIGTNEKLFTEEKQEIFLQN